MPKNTAIAGRVPLLLFLFWSLPFFLPSATLAEETDANYTSTLQTFRPLLLPRKEGRLEPGESRFRIQSAWLNIWSLQDDYFLIDAEEVSVSATLRFAPSRFHQIGVRLGAIHQSGGILDRTIEAAHRISGVGQGQRDRYPRNAINVSYEPYGKYYPLMDRFPGESMLRRNYKRIYPRVPWLPPIDLESRNEAAKALSELIQKRLLPAVEEIPLAGKARSGVEDPRFFLQSTLYQGNGFLSRLHAGMEIKAPVYGGELIGSPGIDLSLSLTGTFLWTSRISFTLGASFTRFGSTRYRFIQLANEQWVLRPTLNYKADHMDVFFEYLYFSKPARSFGKLSRGGHQIAAGLRLPAGRGKASILLIENLINFGVTPDIALQTSYEMPL